MTLNSVISKGAKNALNFNVFFSPNFAKLGCGSAVVPIQRQLDQPVVAPPSNERLPASSWPVHSC